VVLTSIKGQSLTTSVFTGDIIRHRDYLNYTQPSQIWGLELQYDVQQDTLNPWKKYWGYPELSHHLHVASFNNKNELGFAIGYFPTLKFDIFKIHNFIFSYRMGTGLSYFNRPYEVVSNPNNNAIGSHFNMIISASFEATYHLKNRLSFFISPQFYHYSNAASKIPNAGINTITFRAGVKGQLNHRKEIFYKKRIKNFPSQKVIGHEINVGIGFRQINIPNGLLYKVPQLAYFVHYNRSAYFRLVGGLQFEYNFGNFYFSRHQKLTTEVSHNSAMDLSLKVASDLVFGNIFVRIQLGAYLPLFDKDITDPISSMLAINYTTKTNFANKKSWYIGLGVRSHKFVAQYLSLNTGFIL